MKKTLVALAVTAFAASASAFTVYENEGTKFELDGSIRLLLSKQSEKYSTSTGEQVRLQRAHSNLANQGSRFGFSIKHNISEDFYALGRYETRLGAGSGNSAKWGGVTTHSAYVGLGGHGHLVTFGKQTVIGDEIGLAGFDKALGVGSQNIYAGDPAKTLDALKNGQEVDKADGILTAESDSAVSYKYTGIKGLTLGANYNFANERQKNEVKDGKTKSGFGFGAIYAFDIAEGQKLETSAGYTHDDYVQKSGAKKDKDGFYFGLRYKVAGLTAAVDGGFGTIKTKLAGETDKVKTRYVRAGARYDIAKTVGVYGNYSYGTVKLEDDKVTAHQLMLGSDYKLHKNVVTFVEGRLIKQKDSSDAKFTDKAVAVGLRVLF